MIQNAIILNIQSRLALDQLVAHWISNICSVGCSRIDDFKVRYTVKMCFKVLGAPGCSNCYNVLCSGVTNVSNCFKHFIIYTVGKKIKVRTCSVLDAQKVTMLKVLECWFQILLYCSMCQTVQCQTLSILMLYILEFQNLFGILDVLEDFCRMGFFFPKHL